MTGRHIIKRFARAEDGAVLLEFALVAPLLLLLTFGLIDFGRLGFSQVMAQKATEMAVRRAVVTAPICAGLPKTNARGALSGVLSGLGFGASCSLGQGLCRTAVTVSCTAEHAPDLWAHVAPLMPANATPANLTLTYAFDPTLGFLGGPYTPYVTAEITDLRFAFVTPLGALARLAGVGDPGALGDPLTFPSMSASLPAEALLIGDDI
ncbi:TadE/TadG family type IV pilus assembly protein [Loktanella sp. M215]|uniref:TadE/TadG family type IV pilus assembly protein n=1 Tax=Loktanella sp. M215 TaxID=2675431 RepID=UPI001F15D29A|nr:TadE/TadG family type IV pilus assembly protein [Loktanella sp. M215]MCF7699480.1 pilus assembly protein [Loktanella sp. M215]